MIEHLEIFKVKLTEELENLLKQYLDDDFLQLIRDVLDPFIEKQEGENLCVERMNTGSLFGDFGIEMSVGNVPVNKYFNTFRFRLFSLGVIAAFNFKSMKNEHFLFHSSLMIYFMPMITRTKVSYIISLRFCRRVLRNFLMTRINYK